MQAEYINIFLSETFCGENLKFFNLFFLKIIIKSIIIHILIHIIKRYLLILNVVLPFIFTITHDIIIIKLIQIWS